MAALGAWTGDSIETIKAPLSVYPLSGHMGYEHMSLSRWICEDADLEASATEIAMANKSNEARPRDTQKRRAISWPLVSASILPAGPTALALLSGLPFWTLSTATFQATTGSSTDLLRASTTNPERIPAAVRRSRPDPDQALRDRALLETGEQSTRALLTRILRTIGVRQVTVDFV